MDKIRLTIAIPTYNGLEYISSPLNSIFSQLGDVEENIEILIADNCSDKGYLDIINKFRDNPRMILNYYRHPKNIGFDRNCDFSIRNSKGLYVWLLSDDAIIEKGGISRVLDIIHKFSDLSVIFVNSLSPTNTIRADHDLLCQDGNEFFFYNSFKNGLLSSNIINMKAYSSIDASKYFDSGWIHFGAGMELVQKEFSYIVSYPYVKQGSKISDWGKKGQFINVGLNFIEIIKTMDTFGYDKKTINNAYSAIMNGYKYNIPIAKSQGLTVDSRLLKRTVSLYSKFPSFWLFYLPLLLLPNAFFKFCLNKKFCAAVNQFVLKNFGFEIRL